MDDRPCDAECIRRMLDFLPAFERGEFRDTLGVYLRTGRYPQRVSDLIAAVGVTGFMLPFDWTRWDWQAQMREIDTADLVTLRKLMTAFVRGDRFSGGAMAGLCEDGTVERVLRRLRAIAPAADA